MRGAVLVLAAAAALSGAPHGAAVAQGTLVAQSTTVRFDRPIFTTESAVLCPRQHQIAALRRALDDNDRAAFDRAVGANGACKLVGPDLPLTVVTRPGTHDPDVEVRVGDAQALDGGLPRGKVWTLKMMVRN